MSTGVGSVAASGTSPGLGLRLLRGIVSNFILRRLVKAFVTVFVVITLTFFIIRLMPGNPVQIYIQEQMSLYGMTYADAAAQASAMFAIDLSQPVAGQYLDYLVSLSHGDHGKSFRSVGTPVSTQIAKFLPWMLSSVDLSLLPSFTLGMLLGMVMAYRRESLLDHVLSTVGSILSSVPNYLVAVMLLNISGRSMEDIAHRADGWLHAPGIQPGFTLQFLGDILYSWLDPRIRSMGRYIQSHHVPGSASAKTTGAKVAISATWRSGAYNQATMSAGWARFRAAQHPVCQARG